MITSAIPKASIVVLTYNKFEFLEENLKSIFRQTHKNIEVVISDDGSVNFDEIFINDIIKRHNHNSVKCILLHNSKNQGIVKNYNTALKQTSGDYIFPLFCDDLFHSDNTVELFVDEFEQSGCDCITGYRELFTEDLSKLLKVLPEKQVVNQFLSNPKDIFKIMCMECAFFIGAATPFRGKLIETHGYIDESYTMLEDWPRYISWARNGVKFNFFDQFIIKTRVGGITTSGKPNLIATRDVPLVYEKEILPYSYLFDKKTGLTLRHRYLKKLILVAKLEHRFLKVLIFMFKRTALLVYRQYCKWRKYEH